MSALDWTVEIDFNRDGIFTDITSRVMGTIKWACGFKPYTHIYSDRTITVIVDNSDRAFSPEYSGGAYYGLLNTGNVLKISFDGTPQYIGVVIDYSPAPLRYGEKTAQIRVDGMKRVLDLAETYPTLQETVTADEVIWKYVLEAGVPPLVSGIAAVDDTIFGLVGSAVIADSNDIVDVEAGLLTFNYVGDNVQSVGNNPELMNNSTDVMRANRNKTTPYTLIKDLVEAERGYFWYNCDGKFYFRNRNWLTGNTTLAETYDLAELGTRVKDVTYSSPFEEYYNRVVVEYYPRNVSASATDVLWELDGTLTLAIGETRTIDAIYANGVGGKDLVTPSGADFVVSAGTATISVDTLAQKAILTLTNTGGVAATITTITLKGKAITSLNKSTVTKINVSEIGGKYVKKTLELKLRAIDNYADAEEVAELELRRRTAAGGRIDDMTLARQVTALTDSQLARDVGDRIRVIDWQTDHDGEYHITRIEQSLDVANKYLTTKFLLQKATLSLIAFLTTSDYDSDYSLRYAGGLPVYTSLAQSISKTMRSRAGLVRLRLKKVGTPTGTLTVTLYPSIDLPASVAVVGTSLVDTGTVGAASANGYPDESDPLASGTASASDLTTSYTWVEFDLSASVTVFANTTYWLVLSTSDSDSSSNYVQLATDSTNGYSGGTLAVKESAWLSVSAYDSIFEVYME